MPKTLQYLYAVLLLIAVANPAQSQSNEYVEHFNIFASDSVIVSIPRYDNSFFYTKIAKYGSTDQVLSTGEEFVIRYKPYAGHFGLDTFQVVYFYPNPSNGELAKKSKKVIIKTSQFILNNDQFTVYTNDLNFELDVLANDLIPGGGAKITYLPLNSQSQLSISNDSSKIIYNGCNGAVSENLSYQVTKNGYKELGRFKLNVLDTTINILPQEFKKFLVKNSSINFTHPYAVANISKSVSHGTLAQNGLSWTFSPTENYIGLDTLEFEVTNGISTALHRFIFKVFDAATPNILVKDDYFYSLKGQYVVCDLLKNDFDMVLNVSLSVQPQNGSLVKMANGVYKYTPNIGFEGVDVFVYNACDLASNVCEYGTVTVTVSYFTPEPVYNLSTTKGSPIKIFYPFPTSGYKVSVIPSAYPRNGIVYVVDNQKNLDYSPAVNYVGLDSMKIKYTLLSNSSIFHIVKIYIQIFDLPPSCYANCVWPGDHNNDGRVDMKDLTFIAPFIGESGAPRNNNTQNEYWVGQDAADWDISSNNTNMKYGDGDGDGLILEQDTAMMNKYYRNLHGLFVNKGVNSPFLPFNLRSDKDFYEPGDSITMTFSIGSENTPVLNLSAFTVSLNFSEAFNDQSLTTDFKPNHWLSDGDKMLQMAKKPIVRNIDLGAGRVSGTGTAGYGDIAVIKGIVDDELDGFKSDEGIFYARIQLNDATLVIDGCDELRTAQQIFEFPIKIQKSTSNSTRKLINLYPNPTNSHLTLKAYNKDNIINSYHVYTITGQSIMSKGNVNQNQVDINLEGFHPGIYIVKTFTSVGVEINKIEKL